MIVKLSKISVQGQSENLHANVENGKENILLKVYWLKMSNSSFHRHA